MDTAITKFTLENDIFQPALEEVRKQNLGNAGGRAANNAETKNWDPLVAMKTLKEKGDLEGMNKYFRRIAQATEFAAQELKQDGAKKEELDNAVIHMKKAMGEPAAPSTKDHGRPLEALSEEERAAQAFTGEGKEPSSKKTKQNEEEEKVKEEERELAELLNAEK